MTPNPPAFRDGTLPPSFVYTHNTPQVPSHQRRRSDSLSKKMELKLGTLTMGIGQALLAGAHTDSLVGEGGSGYAITVAVSWHDV
jgi:hypothetical protein